MIPMVDATMFAVRMAASLAAKMAQIGSEADISGASQEKITTKIGELEAAVKAAKDADDREANSFFTELGAVLRHGIEYFEAKREFESASAGAKANLDAALAAVRSFVANHVTVHQDAPGKLLEARSKWSRKKALVEKAAAGAEPLVSLEGWSGTSASNYSSAAQLQATAVSTFGSYVETVSLGYQSAYQLNLAVLYTVEQELLNAVNNVKGYTSTLGNVGSEYYRRTCASTNELYRMLIALSADVTGRVAGDAANALSAQLAEAQTSSSVLTPGQWPTGIRGDVTGPENMNTVTTPTDVDMSTQHRPSTETPGVNY